MAGLSTRSSTGNADRVWAGRGPEREGCHLKALRCKRATKPPWRGTCQKVSTMWALVAWPRPLYILGSKQNVNIPTNLSREVNYYARQKEKRISELRNKRTPEYVEAESAYSPRTFIVSSCCNRRPRLKSQLNGSHGEATNSDDVKGKDRKQDRRIASLEQRLRGLLRSKPKTKSGKRKSSNSKRPANRASGRSSGGLGTRAYGANAAAPAVDNFDQQVPIATTNPSIVSAVAQISPFRIPKGIAGILNNARPSQKITARALGTITIANASTLLMNVCPCVASDSTTLSAAGMVCVTANLADATSQFTSTTVGAAPANTTVYPFQTNTPYSMSTLTGGDYHFRLVSTGIRFRNTTSLSARGGVLKYLVDTAGHLLNYGTANTATYQTILTAMDANHKTVRVALGSHPDVEIAVPTPSGMLNNFNTASGNWNSVSDSSDEAYAWYGSGVGDVIIGGTTSTNLGGIGNTWIAFPNSSGNTQAFDVEIIEHWEISGSAIETLHTPSASHSGAADLLQSITSHAHSHHSMTPSLHFSTIIKDAAKLEHNKAAMQDAGMVATALAML